MFYFNFDVDETKSETEQREQTTDGRDSPSDSCNVSYPRVLFAFYWNYFVPKKIGAELIDVQSGTTILNQSAKLENLLVDDSLRDVILDVLRIVTSSVEETELKHILLPIAIEDFHASEYLYWYDYVIENASRYKSLVNQPSVPRELSILAEAFIGNDAKTQSFHLAAL